jgi:hypothetical protein
MTVVTTYDYIDSDGTVQTADMTPEMIEQAEAHRVFLFTDPAFINAQKERRTELLKKCDWTQGVDVPDSIRSPYQTYRASLRDLPTHSNWPLLEDDDWPSQPEV